MIKKYYSLLLWSVFICLIHSSLLSASVSKDDESLLGTMFVRDTTFSKYAAFCNNSGKPTIVFKGNSSISLPPIIDFTFTNNNVCSGQTISFTSTVTGISPLTYAWDFGDGSTSTLENPSHSFQAILGCGTQVFNVTLIVTDSNSDTETISKPITVKRKPDISFEDVNSQIGVPPFENCNQSSINYTVSVGNISNSSSCITSYSIDWGDGISASNVSFPLSHTYQSIGSFNMVINGLGSNGCQVQKVYLVKNSSNPSGGLPSPGGTVNLCTPMGPLQFTITQWGANPIDTFYNVDFGDGTTFTLTQNDLVSSTYYNSSDPINSPAYPIPHTYMLSNCPNSSSYTLLLDIITSCGETNLTQGPISILEKPEVSFIIPDTACINVNVTINNTSSTGYNPNCNTDVDWFWDMGDGTTYMDFEPVHSYSAPGIYTVSLYAQNYCGDTNIVTEQICVEEPLTPDFAFSTIEGCTPLNVMTTNNTDITFNCSPLNYSWSVTYQDVYCALAPEIWSYGAGTSATSEEPQFNFVTPGIYTVQGTISGSSCGTVMSVPQDIIVKKPPTASISSIGDFCHNGTNNTISPTAVVDPCAPNSTNVTYAWNFPSGSPATSSQANPTNITYLTPGIYTVYLVVTNECGPVTALNQTFEIFPEPEITGELTACVGQTSQLTASTTGSNWMSSNSFVAAVNSSGLVTGGNAGNATITFTDNNGCADSISFDVVPAPIVSNQPITSQESCTGGVLNPLTFTIANGVGTPTYQWYRNTNDNTTSGTAIAGATVVSFTPNNTVVSTVFYYCEITFSSGGCTSILTNTARVTIFPLPTITDPINSQDICEGGNAVDLNVQATSGTGNLSYQWFSNTSNANTGGTAISGATQATYTPPTFSTVGTFYYYAVATYDGSGCGSVASNVATINVIADPVVTTQPLLTQTQCQGANANALTVAIANGLGTPSYQWFSNTTNSNTGGTLLNGQTSASVTPPTTNLGTLYYFCVITQSVSGCETTSDTSEVIIVAAPIIISQPIPGQDVCLDGNTTYNAQLLQVAFTNGAGTASYQWYSNTTNATTGGSLIAGATTDNYLPPTDAVGELFYYCEITFSQGGCSSIFSNTARVEVHPLPIISTNPITTQDICEGGTSQALSFSTSGGVGNATYQWYSNTTNSNTSGGTAIVGANQLSYTPPVFNTSGVYYFYAEAIFDGSGCSSTVSDAATITVIDDPIITSQPPTSQTQCQNGAADDLVAAATGGIGALIYQWYSNNTTSNTGGAIIAGATSPTYSPPTTSVGTVYYYCVVSQEASGCDVASNLSTVEIVPSPSISTQPNPNQEICISGTLAALTVSFTNGAGTATYQWYSNSSNSTLGGTPINGATSSFFTPPSGPVGELFYYCELLFSQGGCNSIFSNTARVGVFPQPAIVMQPLMTQAICEGGMIMPLSIAVTGGTGNITYQWYSNTTNFNTGGTAISGATLDSYTPPVFNMAGDFYFYAVATLDGIGCGSAASDVSEVNVVPDPDVTSQPLASQTHCQGAVPNDLNIVAANGIGTFSYQWYENISNSAAGGTLISGANGASFTPDTSAIGIFYYYCEITQAALGCDVTSDVASLEVIPAPSFSIQPMANQELCINGSTDILGVAFSNGTGTASYQWYSNNTNSASGGTAIAGETNTSFTPPSDVLGEFFYYCEIMFSQGGCTAIVSNIARVEVVPEAIIVTDPFVTQDLCVGGTIMPLIVAVQDGAGLTSYQWHSNTLNSNTGGSPISGAAMDTYTPPAFITAGTYYFYAIVSFTGNGCSSITSAVAEVVVVEDPIVSSQPISNQMHCQGAASDVLVVVATGGLGTYSYQWYTNNSNANSGGTIITGETTDTYIPLTNTVGISYYYCEIVQTGLGCNVTSDISVIEVVPVPLVTVQPIDSNVCEGDNVNLMNVVFSNGTSTPNYQWFSNVLDSTTGGNPIAGETSSSFLPQSTIPGTTYYYCEITFTTGGCPLIVSDAAAVIISQFPIIQDQNYVVCTSDVFTMDANQGGMNTVPSSTEYTWAIISNTPAAVVNGATSEATPQSSFTQNLTNTTTQVGTVVYDLSPIAGICAGNNFTVTIDVFPTPLLDFSIPNQTLCNQFATDLVTLSSSSLGNITYNWTANVPPGISGVTPNGTDTIPLQTLVNITTSPLTVTYTATATFNTNGSSCEGPPADYSITVNPQINTSATFSDYNGFNVSFFGGSDGAIDLSVNGGSSMYSYSWTGPNSFVAITQDLNNVVAGDYTVAIDDGVCSPLTLNFTLTQPPELLFEEDLSAHVDLVCFGDSDGELGIVITQDSVAPYTFEILDSSGAFIGSIINVFGPMQVFTGLSAGLYTVRITDTNGGVKELTDLALLQPDDILITDMQTPITCYGADDATMTITVTGGNGGPYTATWSNLATGFFQANLDSDNYDITVTDRLGCTKTLTFFVPEAPIFDINPVATHISCAGANDGRIALNLIGGLQPLTLTWGDGSTAGVNRNNLAPGIYSVTIEDGTPCFINESFTILEPLPIVVDGNTTDSLDCDNANTGAINLIVSGGTPPFTYNWSNGSTTEDLDNITSGNYLVTVTDSRGCNEDRSFTIIRSASIELSVTDSMDVDCEANSVYQEFVAAVSGGIPPYAFSWSIGAVSGANNEFMTTNQNGLITLIATDARGCIQTYNFDVDLQAIGDPGFLSDSIGFTTYGAYSVQDPIQFTNTASVFPISISWDFGDGTFSTEENPVHSYVTAGQYTIIQTVTYEYGCVKTFVITIFISKGYKLIIPSAFTPNEDNLNDTFRPRQEGLEDLQFDIYDSWGSLIFSEYGETIAGWDGLINGREAENGNYYYKLKAKTFYGETITAGGPFTKID